MRAPTFRSIDKRGGCVHSEAYRSRDSCWCWCNEFARARSIVQCTSRTCGSIALGVPNRLDFAGGDISQVAQAFPFHCQFAISAQICFRRRTKWKSNMQIYAATIDLHKFCALTCSLLTPCNVLRTRKFYILRRARELLIVYGMNDYGQRVEWSASQCALEVVRYVWTCAMRRN